MPPTAAEKTWESCLTHISDQISTQSFRTWFSPITPLSLDQNNERVRLRLAVPDAFHTEWLESHYAHVIRKAANDVVGQQTEIAYEVTPDSGIDTLPTQFGNETLPGLSGNETAPARFGNGAPPPAFRTDHREALMRDERRETASSYQFGGPSRRQDPLPASPTRPAPRLENSIKADYTFQTFIEGDCNRLARSAAVAIAENPGKTSFNPFLVYGGVGLGKTHIVQAIGNHVIQARSMERVLYVSSEQFTSQFVRSIQENRVSDFSSFYRQIDLLIVDDVQFFGGKEKTQEEFFHVFNELHQAGSQIILCADRPPSEISGIEERLLSRFKWGLSADIQVPDLETRIAILQHKAAKDGLTLHPEAVTYVAERIRANIRQLEGALLKLAAHARLYGRTIDVEAAKDILRDMMEDYQVRLEIEDIQRSVAHFYGISPELLSAKSRKREIVTARHVAMYFCKQLTTHSLKSIGLRFGGRDHSTVIHACGAIEDRIGLEPAFRSQVEEVEQKLERQATPKSFRRPRAQIGVA